MPIAEAAIIDDAKARAVEVEETVTDSKQENNGTGAGPANAGNLEQKSVDSVDPTPTCNQPTPTLASLNLEGGQHSSESDTPKGKQSLINGYQKVLFVHFIFPGVHRKVLINMMNDDLDLDLFGINL